MLFILPSLLCCLRGRGVSGVVTERLSVGEGESVTLKTDVETTKEDIRWYFTLVNDTLIAGDQSKICTDDQCKERFRDRLRLDLQTGSLTIKDSRPTDSGVYKLKLNSSRISTKIFIVTVHSFFSTEDEDSAFVLEGDSVILHTGVEINQQEKVRWYYNNIRIAEINRDQSKICTDVQCNEDTERFRDRLKLDHQTGSLTIMNIRNTDSGVYKLRIISNSISTREFILAVYDFPVGKVDEIKRKAVIEGESVTLDTHVKKGNDSVMWYFNDSLVAEITGDQSKICTDDQCDERFRDRLKLDNSTGSLTIINITNTHSGLYKLQINSRRISIIRSFDVTVSIKSSAINVTGSAAVICVGVVLLVVAAVAAVIYYHQRKPTQAGHNGFTRENNHDEKREIHADLEQIEEK